MNGKRLVLENRIKFSPTTEEGKKQRLLSIYPIRPMYETNFNGSCEIKHIVINTLEQNGIRACAIKEYLKVFDKFGVDRRNTLPEFKIGIVFRCDYGYMFVRLRYSCDDWYYKKDTSVFNEEICMAFYKNDYDRSILDYFDSIGFDCDNLYPIYEISMGNVSDISDNLGLSKTVMTGTIMDSYISDKCVSVSFPYNQKLRTNYIMCNGYIYSGYVSAYFKIFEEAKLYIDNITGISNIFTIIEVMNIVNSKGLEPKLFTNLNNILKNVETDSTRENVIDIIVNDRIHKLKSSSVENVINAIKCSIEEF